MTSRTTRGRSAASSRTTPRPRSTSRTSRRSSPTARPRRCSTSTASSATPTRRRSRSWPRDAGIEIVDEQTIENADIEPADRRRWRRSPSQQPDVILAVPLGAQCPAFLTEVANAKAANPGWEPRIYITATCASTLLLTISGAAADGIFTVVAGKDANDPANAERPRRRRLPRGHDRRSGFPADGDFATAAAGWTVGELTVEVLRLGGRVRGRAHPGVDHQRGPQPWTTSTRSPATASRSRMNGAEDPYGARVDAGRPVRRRHAAPTPTSAS